MSKDQVLWRSLEEKANPSIYKGGGEFQSTPLKDDSGQSEVERRDFMKLMAASVAMASSACLKRPVQKIVPYANRPEEIIPGISNYYSSSTVSGGEGFGLVVKTREGKPIKVEGNADHPLNKGSLTARAQAHVIRLYDQDRIKGPVTSSSGSEISWEDLDKAIAEQIKKGDVAVLTSSLGSPSTSSLISDFNRSVKGKHYVWDALDYSSITRGQNASYGKSVFPRYKINKAKLILSVQNDFLGTFVSPAEFSTQFGEGRKDPNNMSRLVVFESLISLTGSNADTRFTIAASAGSDVLMSLAHEIVITKGLSRFSNDSGVKSALEAYAGGASRLGIDQSAFSNLAEELWEARGKSLVLAGAETSLQIAANLLNSILENDGETIDYERSTRVALENNSGNLAGLIEDIKKGSVKTLIIHKLNPVYSAPEDSGFHAALKKVGMVVYTGDRMDETGALSTYIAPDHHDLENWGDAEVVEGLVAIQQPTIRPMYNTRSFQDSLMAWAKTAEVADSSIKSSDNWYSYLRGQWKNNMRKMGASGDFETFWLSVLERGFQDGSADSREKTSSYRRFNSSSLKSVSAPRKPDATELILYSKVGMGDGQCANVAWLQEFPDPISKIVWDSYVVVSPGRAKSMSLHEGDVVKVSVGSGSVEVPVHIQAGTHDSTVGLAVGYGRERAGSIGSGIGVNAFKLAQFNGGDIHTIGLSAKIESTGKNTTLANVQGHNSLEGRPLFAEATLDEYLKNPETGIHKHKIFSLWPEHKYPGHKWAMSIDLNACIGCSACIMACNTENNVPVVGKEYVLTGREMHWIRIDRYHSGNDENPDTHFQPIVCQHCDNAPCETVCPVVATVHSPEGLNEMVYNRCVGTRYCSNNCPYKVRRFNWFNYVVDNHKYNLTAKPLNMALNPEVTVRTRGVMEKCTFCVQRIHDAKNKVRGTGKKLQDGDIKTACQQTCPTDALVFGDMNDPNSKVSQHFAEKRAYTLLEELNAAPAVRYMTKIRNRKEPVKLNHGDHSAEGSHS